MLFQRNFILKLANRLHGAIYQTSKTKTSEFPAVTLNTLYILWMYSHFPETAEIMVKACSMKWHADCGTQAIGYTRICILINLHRPQISMHKWSPCHCFLHSWLQSKISRCWSSKGRDRTTRFSSFLYERKEGLLIIAYYASNG